MLIKSKKGTVVYWTVVFGILVALTVYLLLTPRVVETKGYKGEIPVSLVKASQIAETKMIYFDLAAKYSAEKAVLALAEMGGFYYMSPCGAVKEHNLWNNETATCIYPKDKIIEEAQKNFFLFVKDNMRDYSAKALFKNTREDLTKESEIYMDYNGKNEIDYDLSIKDTTLIGLTDDVLYFAVFISGIAPTYYANPDFNIDIGYNFSDYEVLREQADELVIACRHNATLSDCINASKEPDWKIDDSDDRTYLFSVALGKMVYKLGIYFEP